ncbi:MAG: hypothetical protein H0W23_10375, partial [Chloroflexia bacterium]|nr:hypothetical protein [Chloroflexia bacterium]
MSDGTMAEVTAKEAAYHHLQGRDDWQALAAACDLWAYAFFAPMPKGEVHLVPTSATVRSQVNGGGVSPQLMGRAQVMSAE